MNNTITYKGYIGSVEFSQSDFVFYGKVLGVQSLISYEGSNAVELVNDFQEAIDHYLEACENTHTMPERPYKGCFNIRISPELHIQAVMKAKKLNVSLNKFVENALEQAVQQMK